MNSCCTFSVSQPPVHILSLWEATYFLLLTSYLLPITCDNGDGSRCHIFMLTCVSQRTVPDGTFHCAPLQNVGVGAVIGRPHGATGNRQRATGDGGCGFFASSSTPLRARQNDPACRGGHWPPDAVLDISIKKLYIVLEPRRTRSMSNGFLRSKLRRGNPALFMICVSTGKVLVDTFLC